MRSKPAFEPVRIPSSDGSSGKVLKKEEILNEKEDLEEKQQIQNSHAEYIENKALPESIEVAGIKKNKEEFKKRRKKNHK